MEVVAEGVEAGEQLEYIRRNHGTTILRTLYTGGRLTSSARIRVLEDVRAVAQVTDGPTEA